MAGIVFFLCALTSLICCLLLLGTYRRSRRPLLFWSSSCFGLLAAANILLFVDIIMVPDTDLSLLRTLITFAGVSTMIYGLIKESI